MADPRIELWLKTAPGEWMDPDGVYQYQCVDVPIDYAKWLFPDLSWEYTFGRNNANGHMYNKPSECWDVIWNGPGRFPITGDVIIWDGENPYGHIAVVDEVVSTGVWVIEQNGDGLANSPARRRFWAWYIPGVGGVIGWLRPKLSPTVSAASITPVKSQIEEIALKIGQVEDVVQENGWWYKGNGKRDAWNRLVNVARDVAYAVVREPITVTDPRDGKKVKASLAAYIATIWKRVHRDLPTWITQIKGTLAAQDRKLDAIDKKLDTVLVELARLQSPNLEDATIGLEVTLNGKQVA